MLVLVINIFVHNTFCINIISIYAQDRRLIIIKKKKKIFILSFSVRKNFDIIYSNGSQQ
jgi:hypothetical protein